MMIARQWSEMSCPICRGASRRQWTIASYDVRECRSCGHQYVADDLTESHVEAVYGDDYFYGGGAGYPDYTAEAELLVSAGHRTAALLRDYGCSGRLLDVGCAAGFLLKGLVEQGWDGVGIEPNESMVQYANNQLSLTVDRSTLEAYHVDDQFDVVTMIQVIGHLHDVRAAFHRMAKLTKPGGHCLVEYWDRDSAIARLAGRHWHEYSPPSVLRWFGDLDLDALYSAFGFTRIASGTPKKYIGLAHAKSLLQYRLASMQLPTFGRLGLALVPDNGHIRYPALDLRWALFRKNDAR